MMPRHPATVHLMHLLEPNPNLPPRLRAVSDRCYSLSKVMHDTLADGPEMTAGLRKLLEAKDCFVRQALLDDEGSTDSSRQPD